MIPFAEIEARAQDRVGSAAALAELMPAVADAGLLERRDDAYYLSAMTRRIFQAGMRHAVINERWPVFEDWFWGFDPEKLMLLSEEQLEQAMQEPRLIRHWGKLRTIPVNAGQMRDVSRRHGGFGRYLANWPDSDITGLWQALARQFERMGGDSASRFLRLVGRDTFLLTNDVVAALKVYGVVDSKPTRKEDRWRVTDQFMAWKAESGRPMAQISRILSLTVD